MPRHSREKSGTGIYHVMLRGINRQDIFEDEDDYRKMILCLRGLVERTDESGLRIQPSCLIYAYCLMSNHLHLLVQEKDEGAAGGKGSKLVHNYYWSSEHDGGYANYVELFNGNASFFVVRKDYGCRVRACLAF